MAGPAEDVRTWSHPATPGPACSAAVDRTIGRLSVTDGPCTGVSFSTADTGKVWSEGTAHPLAASGGNLFRL
ncbi:hypothetical protein [Kitasatospora sp. NPDC088351]|uniref:hypothetical protein n=1 Tax=unclassified Kitasatospora TaxID=2633591 RepID=UPI00342E6F3B